MMILRKYFINNIIKYMKYLIIIFSLLFNSLSISKDIYFKDLLKKDGIFMKNSLILHLPENNRAIRRYIQKRNEIWRIYKILQ